MTIAEIKEQLPTVKINLNSRIVAGQISGHYNQFAAVNTKVDGIAMGWDFSWQAIERAINNNTALEI